MCDGAPGPAAVMMRRAARRVTQRPMPPFLRSRRNAAPIIILVGGVVGVIATMATESLEPPADWIISLTAAFAAGGLAAYLLRRARP